MTIHAVQAISDLGWHQTRRGGRCAKQICSLGVLYTLMPLSGSLLCICLVCSPSARWLPAEERVKVAGTCKGRGPAPAHCLKDGCGETVRAGEAPHQAGRPPLQGEQAAGMQPAWMEVGGKASWGAVRNGHSMIPSRKL